MLASFIPQLASQTSLYLRLFHIALACAHGSLGVTPHTALKRTCQATLGLMLSGCFHGTQSTTHTHGYCVHPAHDC
jgi:hypothetical protein